MCQVAEERVYEWDVAEVGDAAPPHVFEVTAEKIADFCRVARYENPAYTNQAAARALGLPGLVAPPAMVLTYAPLCLADLVVARGYVAPEPAAHLPHAIPFVSISIDFQRVVVPGDVITSVTSVQDKLQHQAHQFITFRVVAHNQKGELVAEYRYTCLWSYVGSEKMPLKEEI
jgi:acyl dehydratase